MPRTITFDFTKGSIFIIIILIGLVMIFPALFLMLFFVGFILYFLWSEDKKTETTSYK